jgi:hypothetical protein
MAYIRGLNHKKQKTIRRLTIYKDEEISVVFRNSTRRVFGYYDFEDCFEVRLHLRINRKFNEQNTKLELFPVDPVRCSWCGCLTHLPEVERQFFPLCPACLKEHQNDWQNVLHFA